MGDQPSKVKDDCDPNVNGDKEPKLAGGFPLVADNGGYDSGGGGNLHQRKRHELADDDGDDDNNDDDKDDDDDKTKTTKDGGDHPKPSQKPTQQPPDSASTTEKGVPNRYSAAEIAKKCKHEFTWCNAYLQCLRTKPEMTSIFPEMKNPEKWGIPKDTEKKMQELCKKAHIDRISCEKLERDLKEGVIFSHLLDQLVTGNERSGSGCDSGKSGLIMGSAIAVLLLLLIAVLTYFLCIDSKKGKHGGPKSKKFSGRSGLKSGRKSVKSSRLGSKQGSHKSKSGRKSSIKSGKSKSAAKSSKSKQKSSGKK